MLTRSIKIGIATIIILMLFHATIINALLSENIVTSSSIKWLDTLGCSHYHQLIVEHSEPSNALWRQSAVHLAQQDGKLALQLAQYFQQVEQISPALKWFMRASDLGQSSGGEYLAHYFYNKEQLELATEQVKRYPEFEWAKLLSVKIALRRGLQEQDKVLFNVLSTFPKGELLLAEINRYTVVDQQLTWPVIDQSCRVIAFYATNLEDLRTSTNLIEQISATFIGRQFCFSTPQYIPLASLACQHQEKEAISCDESIWQQQLIPKNTHYLAVMLPKGGANVQSGILYLDSQDDVNVLKHELLHLLGFVDEYPLPAQHTFCRNDNQQTPAINGAVFSKRRYQNNAQDRAFILAQLPWQAFIEETTPVVHDVQGEWHLGTPTEFKNKIGVYLSKTCINSNVVSVKPINDWSTLEYYEVALPSAYQLFISTLSKQYQMPSFHYNVADALMVKGEVIEAQQWLEKASK